ncbi:MAG: DNA translocase FtsK 4TM domain-containing protein [Thermodesulfobacteriota bacterium]|nr:DNA translocase FtsK 4TM domain-containing protein [Thermodesulfobacteriota bacterium]
MKEKHNSNRREYLKKEISALFWLAFGIYLLLCLISFNNNDPSFNNNLHTDTVHNYGGPIGAHLADLMYQLFGLSALILPPACFMFTWRLLRFRDIHLRFYKVGAFLTMLFSLDGLIALNISKVNLLDQTMTEAGGAIGRIFSTTLIAALNIGGATLVLTVFFLVSTMLLTRFSLVLFLKGISAGLGARLERRREQREQKKIQAEEKKIVGPVIAPAVQPALKKVKPVKASSKKKGSIPAEQEAFDFLDISGNYQLPPLSLLDYDGEPPKPPDRDSLMAMARILEAKLKDFNVNGEVVEVKPGPVVTMFEFAPAPGIKVNKISGLSDDLSMALRATSIRIVAPIPGRGVVGIEIPNNNREIVYLKDILESNQFCKSGGRLPMALGQDIFGQTAVSDLAKMPHLLVAGSTGSGKSVSINTMILSLLYRANPEDVRVIMVDPKMLELSIYEGIPHLLLPVVTDPKKASLALGWTVREMERRYQLMADKGVRNIDGYNKKLAKEEKDKERLTRLAAVEASNNDEEPFEEPVAPIDVPPTAEQELDHGHLPYIVVIVDELADLMMVAGREIEEHIARLAQMARAAGIHLILATQRPSVDVLTGLIKANFPTRISFKVFSRIDSRTILDTMGAENLLGMGDMLFLPPGTSSLERIHGAFVSEVEVQRVVDFLIKQGTPSYDNSILTPPPSSSGDSDADQEYDERYDEAVALVAQAQQASISMVQRRLRIGYNRAARIIEKMEQEGIVGPSDGSSKGREVLIQSSDNAG